MMTPGEFIEDNYDLMSGIISKISRRYEVKGMDEEDISQELFLYFLHPETVSYLSKKGLYPGLIYVICRNRIKRMMYYNYFKKRNPGKIYSLDAVFLDKDNSSFNMYLYTEINTIKKHTFYRESDEQRKNRTKNDWGKNPKNREKRNAHQREYYRKIKERLNSD